MIKPSRTKSNPAPQPVGWCAYRKALARILLAVLCGAGLVGASDNSDVEARVKVAFIYNFARFVEWPAHRGPGPIRIGILGRGELAAPLQEVIKGKSVNGRPIEVAQVNALAGADCCEILLIERSEARHVKEIAQALAEKPVLTVGDGGSCLRDGVMIAFQIADESVRFQINREAAERAGLKISSQLLKVAIPNGEKQQ